MRHWLVLVLFLFALGALRIVACGDYEDQGCLADPCEGVVCPPDDNLCTVEFCSQATGSCVSRPVEDGTSCTYDGLSGVCVEGVCGEDPCEGVVCDDNDACTEDACGYPDGTCEFTPVVCNDYEECTEDTCDPADGCVFTAVEDGTACGSQGRLCVAGECVWSKCGSPEDCNDANDCTEDTCDLVDGCVFTAVKDGTPCAGGTCQAGVCELTGSVLPCTEQGIRNAIAAGGGPYTFDCDGPQTVVTRATILIDNSVIIDGEGNLTIDAKQMHGVFSVASGVTAELLGVTVTGGTVTGSHGDVFGGGIDNEGDLTLTNSTVSGNAAEIGGGISNGGTVTLANTTVSGNTSTRYGGGIEIYAGTLTVTNSTVSGNAAEVGGGINNGGTVTLTNSTVSGNSAESRGGGIRNRSGAVLTVTNSTVSGNSAESHGGGIDNIGSAMLTNSTVSGNTAEEGGGILQASGTMALTNSTVSGNTSTWRGGGIEIYFGTLTLTNSTVSGNTAEEGGGILQGYGTMALTNSTVSGNTSTRHGGGIEIYAGTLTLTNSTVSGNTTNGGGGGIYTGQYAGTLTLTNTLIDNDCSNGVTITSGGGNIESPGDTCGFDQTGDQSGITEVQLNLGELADNGGPTMTHKPGAGGFDDGTSVAIDHIPGDACDLTEDQRGQPRPETDGTMCDVGSVELQATD